jgi:hypothetical protein
MKAIVSIENSGVYSTEVVFGNTIAEITKEIFDELEDYVVEIKKVQFPSFTIMWNSYLARTCFAKGRITEEQFIERCMEGGEA